MSDALNNEQREQLLIAFLDGELNAADRATAEALLESHPEYVQLVDQWKENGSLFKNMPRYQLDSGFANRVIAAIDKNPIATAPPATFDLQNSAPAFTGNVLASGTGQSFSTSASAQTGQRTGLAMIATLAAMLLLTLFVFPRFAEQPSTVLNEFKNPALVNQPENTNPEEKNSANQPQVPNSVLLNSRVGGNSVDTRPVKAITFSRNSGIQQLIWIKAESTATAMEQIEAVFAKHSIPLKQDDDQNSDSSGFEAIHVISTAGKMQKAIKDLSANDDISIRKFEMPVFSTAATAESTAAQHVDSTLISSESNNPEIKAVNKQFGLTEDQDENSIVQFLLVVGTK